MKDSEFIIQLLSQHEVVLKIRKNSEELFRVIPELKAMVNFDHCHPHHHLDVWEHTLLAMSYSKKQFKTRLVLLLHDIGKPFSWQWDGQVRHFRRHPEKSVELSEGILQRLGFDDGFIGDICELIRKHDIPLKEEDVAKNSGFARELFEVQRCDGMAHNPVYNEKRLAYLKRTAELLEKNSRFTQ